MTRRVQYVGADPVLFGMVGSAALVSPPSRSFAGVWEFRAAGASVRCTGDDLLFLPDPEEFRAETVGRAVVRMK